MGDNSTANSAAHRRLLDSESYIWRESEKESWFEWKTTYPLISPHERGIFPRLLSLI